jgi:hypothetical protein
MEMDTESGKLRLVLQVDLKLDLQKLSKPPLILCPHFLLLLLLLSQKHLLLLLLLLLLQEEALIWEEEGQ